MIEYDELLKMYYSCFKQSAEGQVVLNDLENKFYKASLIATHGNDSTDLLLNIGCREVVVYILSKIEEFELQQKGTL